MLLQLLSSNKSWKEVEQTWNVHFGHFSIDLNMHKVLDFIQHHMTSFRQSGRDFPWTSHGVLRAGKGVMVNASQPWKSHQGKTKLINKKQNSDSPFMAHFMFGSEQKWRWSNLAGRNSKSIFSGSRWSIQSNIQTYPGLTDGTCNS